MQDAHEALMAAGFSAYEARAYCALLVKAPANGYQIAQQSGVPRAKIYECLERLVARGAAVRVETSEKAGRVYAPTDFHALIDDIQQATINTCNNAREALERVQNNPRVVEILWRVASEEDLIARARDLIQNATRRLHVALWAKEFDTLLPLLTEAVDRQVEMAMILYSKHEGIRQLQHRGVGAYLHSDTKLRSIPTKGKQFVVVADRERAIIGSLFPRNDVAGVFTLNRGLVTNAADLVNHEIYLERIMLEIGQPLLDLYGEDLQKLNSFKYIPAGPQ
jgi:sugar-specific transcriptional regulator TrmB